MISIKGLHKFFNKGRQNELHVINDVNLDLPEKGMVAIFGKSGCGKTTLLNVIGGLDKFAQGTLTIENQNIRENTDVIRNQYIGYIFQNYNLNKGVSCFDNVADALRLCGMEDKDEIEKRVISALTNVGMEKYKNRLPDTLSGGQQQRIAIARAIVKNPKIILADEPTGNLDESNTVMIMDLLKSISKEHLVLLVTHEANLVDYYCDTVIELQDGKIVSTKENKNAHGFAARDKNAIYLGELSQHEISDENAEIQYYGDKPQTPIKLKIVNNGGKVYVQINTEKVQIIDDTSEVTLYDGVYEEKAKEDMENKEIDMSGLPPIQGTKFGRLFSLKSSIKSGYLSNFKVRKRGKKTLRRCLILFAAIVVFMSSNFGRAFANIMDAKNAYNHNVFYVYTPTTDISKKLNDSVNDKETGIDYVRLMNEYPFGDSTVDFRTGTFETFSNFDLSSSFSTNAVYLDMSLAKNKKLIAGKNDNLSDTDILITTKVADELVKKSTLGYISERKDLIGLVSNMFSASGNAFRIAGIVKSDESAIYMTEITMAKYVCQNESSYYTALASDFNIKASTGEAILAIKNAPQGVEYPKVGETIKIKGRDIKIVEIKQYYGDYAEWLESVGIKKKSEDEFFSDLVKVNHPELTEGTDEFNEAENQVKELRYFEYYDYFYSDTKEFFENMYLFNPSNIYLWMYLKKDIEIAKYHYLPEDYFKAVSYKELYGKYPSRDELMAKYEELSDYSTPIRNLLTIHDNEFMENVNSVKFYNTTYMVSEEDYIAFSKQLGETHPTAMDSAATPTNNSDIGSFYDIGILSINNMCYTVIHSEDPEKTARWLDREFADLKGPNEYFMPIITPDSIFHDIIQDTKAEIISNLISMAVLLALMSVCMCFIMRSSMISRIREIGIYRAIGVSKKNIIFKFLIESAVLATFTVFVGYLTTSGFLAFCLGMSSAVENLFFYPLWFALAILALLYAISLFFGTLPVISLLRKTPSEILAKYDI